MSSGPVEPWRDAPTGELGDQLLPRWFVLTAIVLTILAVVVIGAAFVLPGRAEVSLTARRPPPADGWTTAVDEVEAGSSPPVAWDAPCALLDGVQLAGSDVDRTRLRRGLAGLCNVALPDRAAAAVRTFADVDGTVRFATFGATGVDSTAALDEPVVAINARYQQTEPLWIAPLFVHDVTARAGAPATAQTALDARRAELATCERLLATTQRGRGCADAADVVALDDPIAELRAAGFE